MWLALYIICFLGAWACSIMVGMKGLQRKQTLLAVLCFLPCILFVGLIIGWVKQAEWGISKNLMLAFTILFVLGVLFYGIGFATAGPVVVTR